jgi:S1-C subfamily serine protease
MVGTIGFLRQLVICLLLLVASRVAGANLPRAIPDDNLANPVFIQASGEAGSGFYANINNAIYVITARHVLYAVGQDGKPVVRGAFATLYSYSKDPSDSSLNIIEINFDALSKAGALRPHPTQDVAVVKIATFGNAQGDAHTVNVLGGVTVRQTAKFGMVGTPRENIATFDEVLVGNDVMLFGYPVSLGNAVQDNLQLDASRPLLRKGLVAGINPARRTIILDCPSYPGNSGGPVVEVDKEDLVSTRFRVIGVMSQYVPLTYTASPMASGSNSGYSVAIPMDFALELMW